MANITSILIGMGSKKLNNYLNRNTKKNSLSNKKNQLWNKKNKSKAYNYLKKLNDVASKSHSSKISPRILKNKKHVPEPWYKRATERVKKSIATGVDSIKSTYNSGSKWASNKMNQAEDWSIKAYHTGSSWLGSNAIKAKDWSVGAYHNSVAQVKGTAGNIFNSVIGWGSNKSQQARSWIGKTDTKIQKWTKEKRDQAAQFAKTQAQNFVGFWHGTSKWMDPSLDIADIVKKTVDFKDEAMKGINVYKNFDVDQILQFEMFKENLLKFTGATKLAGTSTMKKIGQFYDDTITKLAGSSAITKMKGLYSTGLDKVIQFSNTPTFKTAMKVGKRVLNVIDLISPIYKISQAKTGREAVEIGVEEYLPKIASLGAGYLTSQLGGAIIGGTGQFEFAPLLPVASFAAAEGADRLTKKALKTYDVPKKIGNWIFGEEKKATSTTTGKNISPNKVPSLNHSSKNKTRSKSNPIFINMPSGAVQISNSQNSFDYAVIATEVGQQIAEHFRRALENKKSVHA